MPLSTGDKLGPYEITAKLGEGGMGEVYRAHDSRLGRDVAIKVSKEQFSQRFEREARAVAALNHSNICTLHDVGPNYLVMEYIQGTPLKGPLPLDLAIRYAAQICDALDAAHRKGITHRDLKPANILVTRAGSQSGIKLLDFGLAKVGPVIPADEEVTGMAFTGTREILGTIYYMAPEQLEGKPADARSDIFSFGLVLYEMLTGKRAFDGASPATIIAAIVERPAPSISSMATPALDRLLQRCLAKDPDDRWQSARDLKAELAWMASASDTGKTAPATTGSSSQSIDSIAVLPFTNASNDPDTEYLCDGITESIMNSLAQIGKLRVSPRGTVFRYKGRDLDPQAAGLELGVRAVLTGRVIQRGETLVVGTELLDVQAGSQLWGERYNRKISDIFALEEEIARKISESLRVKLTGEEKSRLAKRSTENTEAYQLYLRGRHHWVKRTPDQLKMAVTYFQQAIDKDPGYALAYAGLADCYAIFSAYSILTPRDAYARAKAAAVAAIAFDENLAEGYTSLGFIHAYFDWNWAEAERDFQRALKLNPGYWVTPYWYAMILSSLSRFEEAERQIRRGLELEPLSPSLMFMAAMNSIHARRYGEAIERCLKGLESEDYPLLRYWLGIAYLVSGRQEDAIREHEKTVAMFSRASMSLGALAHSYAVSGNREGAEAILRELLETYEREPVDLLQLILVYLGLGDTESALAWLEKGCDAKGGLLPVLIAGDPRLDPLRSEPRFQNVLKRMNLSS
jgi:eukaryotic-like serine/threonine-protein kinase